MWTNTDTHTAFACINITTIIELTIVPGQPSKGSPASASTTPQPKPQIKPPQLQLQTEVLDFGMFPFTEHTGANIAKWLTDTLVMESIDHLSIAGVSPDGAADGQCAMGIIDGLGEKTDTCDLHRLQRAVLAALGLSDTVSQNPAAKALLRKNGRLVTLSIQSRAVSDGIREVQVDLDIPPHQVLSTVQTATTRWGNQKLQLTRNCLLRPVLDPVIDKYKRENKNNKESIVESNESEQGSKVGQAVPASEIGLSSTEWQCTMELEAFVDQPFAIKQTIEHGSKAGDVAGFVTGAQSLIMMSDLMSACEQTQPLSILRCPPTASLKDRVRKQEVLSSNEISSVIDIARSVLTEELSARFFIARPSNTRLVQCALSKQKPMSTYLTERMAQLATTLYTAWLRRAALITGISIRSSPPRKKPKITGVFRASTAEADPDTADHTGDFDTVTDEIRRWKELSSDRIIPFTDEQGLINEFALMWSLKDLFPLHFIIFKQTAVHIPHEANVEQVFSTAGFLSTARMDPSFLARLVMVNRNKKVFQPDVKAIKAKYYMKFSKAGKLAFEEATLGLASIDEEGEE